jgi:Ni,Fe-hydrogenase III small subunit/formate hydrogenlyase subunit 6/NADH:ubiquinone oxidoreductase subunit I
MLRILFNTLSAKVVTTRYPAEPSVPPDRFRGMPRLSMLRPGSDLPPPSACPVGALSESFVGGPDDAHHVRHVALDLGQCVFCGRCAEDLWAGAVSMGRDFELAARSRDDLRIEVVADGDAVAEGSDGQAVSTERTGPVPDAEAARVAAEIHRVLGRSLHLRHLDSGSCNACDWELSALLNPVYDVRRLGIDFVASPRHADGVTVTGSVTRNLETAVRRTIEAIPEPRLVIAAGACAISGGIAGRGYASAGGVDQALPVDVYIPGCPPRPEAIIFGILVALGRLEARRLR